jgi:hypothetical protein
MERTGKSFDFFFAKCKFCQIPFLSKILKMMENNWWFTSFEGFDKAASNRTYGVFTSGFKFKACEGQRK